RGRPGQLRPGRLSHRRAGPAVGRRRQPQLCARARRRICELGSAGQPELCRSDRCDRRGGDRSAVRARAGDPVASPATPARPGAAEPRLIARPSRGPMYTIDHQLGASHRPQLEGMLRATESLNEAEVAVALELIDLTLENPGQSDYRFLLARGPAGLAGYVCYGPTPMTDGTYDLYWL